MIVALYIFIAVVVVGAVLKLTDRPGKVGDDGVAPVSEATEECCGMHLVCEKLGDAAFADEIEYFDDEELDRFAGRDASDYSDEEIDRFRDILVTLPSGEAPLWMQSLDRRGISLPAALRDEFLIIVSG